MKCIFTNCSNEGEPSGRFDFFACDGCLDELRHEIAVAALVMSEEAKS